MRSIAITVATVMVALTYGEHIFASPEVRRLAHYVFDGMHITWLYLLLLAVAFIGMEKCWMRLLLVGVGAWGAAEGAMTAVCGILDTPRIIPGQWQGLCGAKFGLPLAAMGLTTFSVFVASLWRPNE